MELTDDLLKKSVTLSNIDCISKCYCFAFSRKESNIKEVASERVLHRQLLVFKLI